MTAVVVIRHASAGDREQWSGDDRARPLDEHGRRQAEELAASLADHRFERVISSPYARCVQTVEPLAARLGRAIEDRDELAEGASREETLALLDDISGSSAVLCTHADVVVELLGAELKKGETATLER